MKTRVEQFQELLGQTTPFPFGIDVDRAEGIYFWDKNGKRYTDMIAGVSVNNIGHRHPKVIQRIQDQLQKYMHVMVYGEYIQDASIEFSKLLTSFLPDKLNSVYPVNSGTEAIEAALKLAKRATKRTELIAFKGSYHGSTHGSMSVSYNEVKKAAFRPLLPDIQFININNLIDLERISCRTAAVLIEPVQGDAGVRKATNEFLIALRKRCDETGTLLIFDEIQCGMGRTGKLFAFEHSGAVPDILVLGKALGGGMPIGAFICDHSLMKLFTYSPMLGHITTFGGNPVINAAAWACLEVFRDEIDFELIEKNAQILENYLCQSKEILAIRRVGMMYACDMESFERVEKVVNRLLEKGVISFWFLSHTYSFRLSPPLTISSAEIHETAKLILEAIEETEENRG